MLKEIIAKPLLKTRYIDNRNGDTVTYLEIPQHISREMVVNDIMGNGKHFDSVLKYIDKEKPSRMVLISAENQEMGLMAVTYIAGALGESCVSSDFGFEEENHYDDEFDWNSEDYFDEGCEDGSFYDMSEKWIEQRGRIPVIHASDVACFYSSGYTSVELGMTLRVGQNERRNQVPYWVKCRKEAICIIWDDRMGKQEVEILNKFSTNRRVYAVYAPRKQDELIEPDVVDLPFGNSIEQINDFMSKAVLYNSMDEIYVFMHKEDKWKYYRDIAKQAFRDYHLVNSASIPYDRIVSVAECVAPSSMCIAISKIIEYVLKDQPVNIKRLKKKDFDFLEKFEKRKILGEKRASNDLKNKIVGLDEIKSQVQQIVNVMRLNRLRASMGLCGEKFHNVHVMLGAPGTAKTTVAKLMGEIMSEESLLPGKRSAVVNGAQLKGEYVGQSAPKTHALFEAYDIIIIDEAYSMVDTAGGMDSFSNEAIAQLIMELENHSSDKLVIFAGYGGQDVSDRDNKMQLFLDANPGIRSRIASTFYFPSYSPEEMVNVFLGIAKRNHYEVEREACACVKKYFTTRVGATDFGNGREARNLLDICTLYLADRTMGKDITEISKKEVTTLTSSDVKKAVEYLMESYAARDCGFGWDGASVR